MSATAQKLSFPKITSAHIDDAARLRSEWRQ
jgi:hypothetical protein